MKLRQKFAMVMAATMLATAIPNVTQAATITADRESMTTSSENNLNKYYYVYDEDEHAKKNNAINLKIQNNQGDPIKGSEEDPSIFTIEATDIKFNEDLFINTEDNEGFYALADESEGKDGMDDSSDRTTTTSTSMTPPDYPERLFTIEDGVYTSYVSTSYAVYKKYISKTENQDQYKKINSDFEEVYVFEKVTEKIDGKDVTKFRSVEDYNATNKKFEHANTITAINPNLTGDDKLDWISSNSDQLHFTVKASETAAQSTQVYIKEFSVSLDENDNKVLDVEMYQNFARNQTACRLYVPIAFQVTGKAPSVKLGGPDPRYAGAKTVLSSNGEVTGDVLEVNISKKGELSVTAAGKLGVFEFEEEQEHIFDGNFDGTETDASDYKEDVDDDDIEKLNANGRFFHIQLENSKLEFELNEGNRYWNDGLVPGILQDYIGLTGGLRNYEEDIQVEVIAAEDNELLVRIIDKGIESGKERKYEGGIEFINLPIDMTSRKDELSLGDVEITITEVENLSYGNDLGEWDYDDANEFKEELVLAEVIDEEFMFDVDEEAEVWAGQESDKVELALREIVAGAIDKRDEFYLKFQNSSLVENNIADIDFMFDDGEISNGEEKIFYEEDDDDEYVLDLDALYDIAEGDYINKTDEEKAAQDWHSMLEELTFVIEVDAAASATEGNMNLVVESDNFEDDEKTFIIGKVKKPFTIKTEPIVLDLGVKEQRTGKIVITESQVEVFKRGTEFLIALEDISIKDAKISVNSESELEIDTDVDDGYIKITIEEESDDVPAVITIEDIEFDIWAGTPRGGYDLYISGNAVDMDNEAAEDLDLNSCDEDEVAEYIDDDKEQEVIKESDFLYIGDSVENTQIQTVVDFRAGTTTVNGKKVAMTSKPYITTKGWSMIGVRDLATFFGIDSEHIAFGHDDNNVMTVTITNGTIGATGSTLVTIKNGSKILTVNGTPKIMDEAMTIGSDNRAYAPIRPIAEALGLSVSWNPATNVATFTN
ncbi:hypothetical protein AN641_02610 [Candidatus Epulonipiscioides gigas]|nr:hypothetical protein AN641_02610 [Epulopiscium sp. SCG-C07WGA-EpuloA2]